MTKMVTVPIVPPDSTLGRESYSVYHYHSFMACIYRDTVNDMINNDAFITTLRTMQVDCPHPTCTAKAGEYCNNPKQTVTIHVARWRKSFDEGWWESGVTLSVTMPSRLGT